MTPPDDTIVLTETKLSQLLQSGDLCDVIVQVPDSRCRNNSNVDRNLTVNFRAHKLILVASTPYFYSLYANDQLEDVITLPACVEPLMFSILLGKLHYQGFRNLFSRIGIYIDQNLDNFKKVTIFEWDVQDKDLYQREMMIFALRFRLSETRLAAEHQRQDRPRPGLRPTPVVRRPGEIGGRLNLSRTEPTLDAAYRLVERRFLRRSFGGLRETRGAGRRRLREMRRRGIR